MRTRHDTAPEVAEDSDRPHRPAPLRFARPAAPALDLSPTRSRPPPSSPGPDGTHQLLEPLKHSLDPMLAPDPDPSSCGAAIEPSGPELDECPPTVRTPRNAGRLTPEAIRVDAAAVQMHPVVAVVDAPSPPTTGAESFSDSDAEVGFFRFDSFPPVVEDLEDPLSESSEPSLPPELLARRAGLRKVVGAIVAGAAALAVVAVIVGAVANRDRRVAEAAPAERFGSPDHAVLAVPPAKAAPVSSESDRGPLADQSPSPMPGAVHAGTPAELRTQALESLQARDLPAAAAVARELIVTEPEHAFGYRCLGAALQDQGRWSEALDVYSSCAKVAKRGEVGECVALGGRR